MRLLDWLATPTQQLAEITGGAVFHDGMAERPGGGLAAARSALAWYPPDLWRYVMACQWRRLAQEEAFPGRCAEAGDDLGSALIAARLIRDLIRLVLLMDRCYPPYGKWLGTALARLPCAAALQPAFAATLSADLGRPRETSRRGLSARRRPAQSARGNTARGYGCGRSMTGPTGSWTPNASQRALTSSIASANLRRLPPAGAVDQFIDSTDAAADLPVLRVTVAASLAQAGLDPECCI